MNERQIDDIRRMTPGARFPMWLELSRAADRLWEANLTPAEIERRWQIWRREHDLSDRNMLEAFRNARCASPTTSSESPGAR